MGLFPAPVLVLALPERVQRPVLAFESAMSIESSSYTSSVSCSASTSTRGVPILTFTAEERPRADEMAIVEDGEGDKEWVVEEPLRAETPPPLGGRATGLLIDGVERFG